MIKEVKVDELRKVAEVGMEFFIESNLPGTLNPEVFITNWTHLIKGGVGKIFGLYDEGVFIGALGAIIMPDLNDGELVANEAFWFISKSNRGSGIKLLLFFLDHVKEIGCVRVNMVHLLNQHANQLSKLYEKLGFSPMEKHYSKIL